MVAKYEAEFQDPAGWWGCEVAGMYHIASFEEQAAAAGDEDMGGFGQGGEGEGYAE